MILSLCVFGGITLLAHPRRSKAKFILGASMLFWGVLIILRLSFNPFLDCAKTLFQPMILITGSIVMATTTCYVIEVLRPGYLTFRRFCLFISPAIVCSLLLDAITYVHLRRKRIITCTICFCFRIPTSFCGSCYWRAICFIWVYRPILRPVTIESIRSSLKKTYPIRTTMIYSGCKGPCSLCQPYTYPTWYCCSRMTRSCM